MSSEGNAVAVPAPVDLTELASRITLLGESIKSLKESSSAEPDKDEISKAVKALVDAKRTYATNNGGIGVDGKKWEEPMSKSEKKKAEKAAKAAAAAAAAAGGGGDGKEQAPSKKAAAKEQKKAAKKEAKRNFKEGGGGASAATTPAASADAKKTTTSAAAAAVIRPMMTKSKL